MAEPIEMTFGEIHAGPKKRVLDGV